MHGKNIIFGAGEKSRCDQGMCDRGQAAGNSRRRGQADCRAVRICKVQPKQIETYTGSSCKRSQGLSVLRMESVLSLEQAKKVVVTKECVTEGKQPEILDADGKPIAVQAESAK